MVAESKLRANAAYDAKTYKKVTVKFRLEEDADILQDIAEAKEDGVPLREYVRGLYEGLQKTRLCDLLQHFPQNQRVEVTRYGGAVEAEEHPQAVVKGWRLRPDGTLKIEI